MNTLRQICDTRLTGLRQRGARLKLSQMKGDTVMNWLRFSLAVVVTAVALVIALFATVPFVVGNVLANTIHSAQDHGMSFMAPGGGLPPELASLKDVPAGERFAHFKGVQANLTDKDGKPLVISVTPGVASNVSANSLTIAGNDGATH